MSARARAGCAAALLVMTCIACVDGEGWERAMAAGVAAEAAGRPAAAEEAFGDALARTARLPAEHPYVLESLAALGRVCQQRGKLPEAIALATRLRAALVRLNGPDHPEVARQEYNLGVLYLEARDLPQSLAALERSLVLQERSGFGGLKAITLWRLGTVEAQRGQPARALAAFERALAAAERGDPIARQVEESREALRRALEER